MSRPVIAWSFFRRPGLAAAGVGWRAWLPALVLLLVAASQIALTRWADLSPWKGGGFGMFATTDGTAFRFVRVVVDAPERSEEITLAPSLEDAALRAQLFPSDYFLTRLANAVAARERRYNRPVAGVRVEVLTVDFAVEPLRASERLIRSFTLRVPSLRAAPDPP